MEVILLPPFFFVLGLFGGRIDFYQIIKGPLYALPFHVRSVVKNCWLWMLLYVNYLIYTTNNLEKLPFIHHVLLTVYF